MGEEPNEALFRDHRAVAVEAGQTDRLLRSVDDRPAFFREIDGDHGLAVEEGYERQPIPSLATICWALRISIRSSGLPWGEAGVGPKLVDHGGEVPQCLAAFSLEAEGSCGEVEVDAVAGFSEAVGRLNPAGIENLHGLGSLDQALEGGRHPRRAGLEDDLVQGHLDQGAVLDHLGADLGGMGGVRRHPGQHEADLLLPANATQHGAE